MSTENLNKTDFLPIIYHGLSGMKNKTYMTVATYEPGTAYPSRAAEFTPPIRFIDRWFSMWCFVDHCLCLCSFTFGYCVVCTSTYDFIHKGHKRSRDAELGHC